MAARNRTQKAPTPLRVAVAFSGFTQREVARQASIHETEFSRIVNGRVNPTRREQIAIAAVLEKPIADLWPDHGGDGTPATADGTLRRRPEDTERAA